MGHFWDEDLLEDEVTWLNETLWVGKVLGEDCGLLGDKGMLRVKILALILATKMKGSLAKGKESLKDGEPLRDMVSLKDQELLGVRALLEAQVLLKDTSSVKAKPLLKDKTLVKMTTDHPSSRGRSRTRQCFMPTNCRGGVTCGGFHQGRSIPQIAGPSSGGANSFATFGNDGKHAGAGGAGNGVDDEDGDDDDSL